MCFRGFHIVNFDGEGGRTVERSPCSLSNLHFFCVTVLLTFGFVLYATDEQEVRRSKRTIVPPLQFWKNERIDYERRKSGI